MDEPSGLAVAHLADLRLLLQSPRLLLRSKKGSEPLHIQWNPVTDEVEVVNYGVPGASGLTAGAQVLNLDGSVAWETEASRQRLRQHGQPLRMEFPEGLTPVHFIRLRLSRGDELISENFYWRGTETGNYRALRTLPKVPLRRPRERAQGDEYLLRTELENRSQTRPWPCGSSPWAPRPASASFPPSTATTSCR